MKKNLIICPKCEEFGTRSILGELTPTNELAIMRFHQHYTIVFGDNFGVRCSNCGEPVMVRKQPEIHIRTTKFVGTIGSV